MKLNKVQKFMQKNFNKRYLWTDEPLAMEFYLGKGEFGDYTILIYDGNGSTFREFIVDFPAMRAIYTFDKLETIHDVTPKDFDGKFAVDIIGEYVKNGWKILWLSEGTLFGSTLIGKVSEFENPETNVKFKVLQMKKIAYVSAKDVKEVIGIDTIALPQMAVDKVIEVFVEDFKEVDIELEFKIEGEETNE